MIHFQNSEPGWTSVLPFLPDFSLLKSLQPGLLMDAKLKWASQGRDPAKLITMYRHFDVYSYDVPNDPAGAIAHWVRMYNRWFDGTYRDLYLPHINLCCEANEYTSDSTWANLGSANLALQNVLAAGRAWNDHFRKLTPNTRVCLLAGPVGNVIPDEVLNWAVELDLPVDYHGYTFCQDGVRPANEWETCSGLWNVLEQRAGVKPDWVMGEAGPFNSMDGGWRNHACLGGDETKLVEVARATMHDTQKTDAYLGGRFLGWANYTAGQVGWPDYWLQTPQLIDLSKMYGAEWKPGKKEPKMPITFTDADYADLQAKSKVLVDTSAAIDALVAKYQPAHVWSPGDVAVSNVPVLTVYNGFPGTSVHDSRPNYTSDIAVSAVSPDGAWLEVFNAPVLSVKATDVKPK